MKVIQALYEKSVFIGDLEDCISICTLEHSTAFLDADQIKELIKELETRLEELNK